jgi:hypothetical protein
MAMFSQMLYRTSVARAMSLAALTLMGCFAFEPEPPAVAVSAALSAANLRTTDTLVLRRTIQNVGDREVWLDVSSSVPAYNAFTPSGDRSCYFAGISTMELGTVHMPPGSSVVREGRIIPSSLKDCPPGTYQLIAFAVFYTDIAGAPENSRFSRADLLHFIVTAP